MFSSKDKLKNIKAFHQPTLDALGVPNAILLSKMAYKPSGLSEIHIGFFESEIYKKEDVYIEFGSRDLTPEQVPGCVFRGLYKWTYNPHFKEEYPISDPDPNSGHVRYFVPISELVLVSKAETKKMISTISTTIETPVPSAVINAKVQKEQASYERESQSNELSMVPPDECDELMSEMTIRDYMAIHTGNPVSKKRWLNELIITNSYDKDK